jgi:hypothetical protein
LPQCATCISLKTAAVLATIAEHQGGSARHGSLTSSSSFSLPQPCRRLPGRRQTSPDLKQIVKQLKVGGEACDALPGWLCREAWQHLGCAG